MNDVAKKIRVVARGLIVRDGKLLVIEVDDGAGRWWILPGGKQEFGEQASETVVRECQEELQCEVTVGDCLMVREFIGPRRQEVVGKVGDAHSLELYFRCSLVSEPDLKPREDLHRQITWVTPGELRELKFFPRILAERAVALIESHAGNIYVGDAD